MAIQPPKIRDVPVTADPSLAGFLSDIKKGMDHLLSGSAPPQAPVGLKVTPIAGGNVVQFTRSNATNFRLYASPTNDRGSARIVDLGSNNQYTDNLGDGGVLQYYWLEALSQTSSAPSPVVGPVSATTLPLGTPAVVSPVQQPSYGTVFDTTLGARRPVVFGTDFVAPGKQA